MNNQEAFDKAMSGMLKQKAFSWDTYDGVCSYYDDNKNKCMVGHLAESDDVAYNWQFNVCDIDEVANQVNVDEIFALKMQCAHDNLVNGMDIVDGRKVWDEQAFLGKMKVFSEGAGLQFNYS